MLNAYSKLMGFLTVISVCAVTLVFAQGQEFELPGPPEDYSQLGRSSVENLATAKVNWLRAKKDAEEQYVRRLKRRLDIPDVDKEAIQKDIKKFQEDIKKDEQEIEDLVDKDAFDPRKNKKAAANAKLVKDNVLSWLNRLKGMVEAENKRADDTTKTAEEREKAQKAADAHAKIEGEMRHDLAEAGKINGLFK